jgi:hypothetical protein
MNLIVTVKPYEKTDWVAGGGIVEGELTVSSSKQVKYHNIRIKLIGLAECQWSSHGETYKGNTKLVKQTYDLAGEANGKMNVFEAGEQKYAYSFQLPRGLPSTLAYDGLGDISYKVKARVYLGALKHDAKAAAPFTLLGDYDSTELTDRLKPKSVTEDKHFALAMGKCHATLSLPRCVAVAGASMPFTVTITNNTGKTIDTVRVNCVRHVTWHGHDFTSLIKRHKTVRVKASHDLANSTVAPRAEFHFESVLNWPDAFTTPTFAMACVSIVYGIEVVCKV